MLTFFRRIRKGLLGTGATRKYLVYAIGEIALVVIGILIALQINNWNEHRKLADFESRILNELMQDIQRDSSSLTRMTRRINRIVEATEFLSSLEKYDDSLQNEFEDANMLVLFTPNTSSYETLTSIGIDKITDDNLRRSVVELYRYYEWQGEIIKLTIQDFKEFEWIPFHREFMNPSQQEGVPAKDVWVPREEMNSNIRQKYHNLLIRKTAIFNNITDRVERLKSKCLETLNALRVST